MQCETFENRFSWVNYSIFQKRLGVYEMIAGVFKDPQNSRRRRRTSARRADWLVSTVDYYTRMNILLNYFAHMTWNLARLSIF